VRIEPGFGIIRTSWFDLTPRQRQVYAYARSCIAARGYGPTVQEIARHLGLRSLTGVRRHIRGLQRQGYIQCVQFTARAIQLLPAAGTDPEVRAIVPRGPSLRNVESSVVVDLGLGTTALSNREAVCLARRLLLHAQIGSSR
jgi:SOS-response transcriptional repressor LexA